MNKNTLNNIFKDIHATKAIKYYSFQKEGEEILDTIKTEGVKIVSEVCHQKEKHPTVASEE